MSWNATNLKHFFEKRRRHDDGGYNEDGADSRPLARYSTEADRGHGVAGFQVAEAIQEELNRVA